MNKVWAALFLITLFFPAYSQEYAVSRIPDELKKGASVVLRNSTEVLTINDIGNAVYSLKAAYTILNEEAGEFGLFSISYGKLRTIKGIKLAYYDANGKLLKKVRQGDIVDISTSQAGALSDQRVKAYQPGQYEYPYTIEYEWDMNFKAILQLPNWNPRFASGLAVEHAFYKVVTPKNYGLRYKLLNGATEPETYSDSKSESYFWRADNLPAKSREMFGPSINDISPSVLIGPTEFEMEGYTGRMDTWQNYGNWVKMLNRGKDAISAQLVAEMEALVEGASDTKEKIRRIYHYLQSNTRYVSIQLGIGGFQPFPAMSVKNDGYGDCKALSNFTYALLKSVGIASNYTLVSAGEDESDILTDFPSQQFNHVILAVPLEKDTVWLECTSQVSPFNFLGGFTSDRHVLMITDEGGKLVKTPRYDEEMNRQERFAELTLDAEGNATAEIKTIYKGRQYDDNFIVASKGSDYQRKHLLNTIDIPSFELSGFDYTEEKTEAPTMTESVSLSLRRYASISGKRMFFVPNLMNRNSYTPPKVESRESAVIRKFAYTDVDSVVINIPENYRLEYPPEPVSFESEFGKYNLTYSFDQSANRLTYVRYIQINQGKYPANLYNEFRNFHRKIAKSDKSRLVLIGDT